MKKIIIFVTLILLIFLAPLLLNKNGAFNHNENASEYAEINTLNLTNTVDASTSFEENKEVIFTSSDIPDEIYEKMIGNSIPIEEKENVNIKTLSYLKVTHYGFDGELHVGEMIVNAKLAGDVLEIFKELYEIKYPIEKIKLIDEYDADDELSMSDNNTSCFCYRVVSGANTLSNHALGTAIDINPLYNPYVANGKVSPASASLYVDRNLDYNYKITKDSQIYEIFKKHGWSWGGDWKNKKDYQHFEKVV